MATFAVNETARRNQYVSTGQATYNFNFQVNAASELQVYVNDTLQTDSVAYNATVGADGTGSITFIDNSGGGGTNYTPSSGDYVTIIGDQPLSRTTTFNTASDITTTNLDTEFDNTLFRQQQLKEMMDRSIQLKVTTPRTVTGTGTNGPLNFPYDATPSNNASKVIAYNSSGTGLELGPTTANLNSLAGIVSDISTVAGISSDVTSVAGISSNVTTVAGISSNVSTVAGISSNVTTVAGISSDVTAVAAIDTEIAALSGVSSSDLSTVAGISSEISTVSGISSNISTVAGISANVTTVAGINSDVTTVANNNSNVTTVAGISSNITTVAGISSNVTSVANNSTNINSVAGSISNVNTVASDIANVNTTAANITGVNSFGERYRVSSSAPTTSLDVGDLYYDTTLDVMKVYGSSGWQNAGSSVNGTSQRNKFTATAGQTVFSGSDDDNVTLVYDPLFLDVYLNGVRLVNGSSNDFTATDGSTITLNSGAAAGDILNVVSFGTFNLASFSATNITSGTVNNARLPSTISQTNLIAAGDGSSQDGFITLNCSQNSHGVKIQSPAHSAGQSYTLILPTSVGSNGQVLATAGSNTNQLTWIDATETKPTVANVSQTIAPATATTITITGTNFVSIPIVEFIKTDGSVTIANTVSFTSSTSLSVNVTLASGNYYVRIENPDGNAGRSTNNIITASTAPSFTTSAGSLGTIAGNFSGTVATIAGSSDSAITFSETTSVLTNASQANCSLNSSTGVITTTDFGGSSTTPTTYNFTIRITDAEGQTADRNFSLTSSFGATGGGQFN